MMVGILLYTIGRFMVWDMWTECVQAISQAYFIGLDDEIGKIDNKHLQYQLIVKKIYITNK